MSNKILQSSLPIQLISRYRAELMGLAIFGVLWGHMMNETYQPVLFSQLARLIHTAGFIFLSGFGLYYAFQKNSSISAFYKKRLTRILLPFVLITYWFFIVAFVCKEDTWLQFITNLTATSFWFYGEAHSWAMWYVSATIVLYILFPLLYYILFRFKKPIYGLVVISVLYVVMLFTIAHLAPNYWMNTRIFWARFIMFPLGIFTGYLSANARQVSFLQIGLYFAICILLAALAKIAIDDEIYSVTRTLIGLPFMTLLLHICSRWNWAQKGILKPLQFLGIHSYEIYLMHVMVFYLCRNIIGINSAISMVVGIVLALLLCKPIHTGIQQIMNKI